MAQNHNDIHSRRQAQYSAAPYGLAVFILLPRAMNFWRVRDFLYPQKVYDSPVCIRSSSNTRPDACGIRNSLSASPISTLPPGNHSHGFTVTEFWEFPSLLRSRVFIYQSSSGLVTPVHESLPNMASYDARLIPVREHVVSEALSSLVRNPKMSIVDCYRTAIHNFLRLSVENNFLDLVRRFDLEVDFAIQIIRATKQPEQFTLEQMDNLQALGKSFTELAPTYREIWVQEVTRLNLWPHHEANIVDANEFQRYIGGRDWETEWVQGTLVRNEPEVGVHNNPHHHGNIIDGDNGQEEGSARDVNTVEIDDTALAALEDTVTSAGDGDNDSAADNNGQTILYRGRDAQGIITWSTAIDGGLTPFAQYTHGVGRPWKCLLCDRCLVTEKGSLQSHLRQRHSLAGLKAMKIENENYSNFQGHDDNDCYMWGQYVQGDPRPWKCLLCRTHAGIKVGKKTFARHFQKTHGIRVVLPPVTPEEVRRHNRRRQPQQQ
ncbi:hypothetical protein AYL99_06298 [Fonsecaea erecta]|uniref:Uncharacterized protein n=1 Tax=Fonsecaea erecta TaxID=1367422 RepID=A0A178ZHP1_9EURO|nr:hypothetical protein AYL99_06298 [Fonsecaea erecta]OAP59001.1 hypothetical protein AYL99_06298 [Fonsecaea erecta]